MRSGRTCTHVNKLSSVVKLEKRKMLRNCILPSSYNNARIPKRCGEIICHDNAHFTIVCVLCKLKIFEFEDFLLHYRNVHLQASLSPSAAQRAFDNDQEQKQDKNGNAFMPDEEFENVEYLADLGNTCNDDQEHNLHVGILSTVDCLKEEMLSDNELEYNDHTRASDGERVSESDRDDDEVGGGEWEPTKEEDTDDDDDRILKKRKPKEYACEHCPKRYTTERILKLHINMQHLRPKDFKCDQCNEAFSEQRILEAHKRNVHIGFPCPQCDRVYKTSHTLRVHSLTHKETKDFICDFANCGKAFVSKTRLTTHKKIHTEERNYICEVCGYRTRQKDALVVHKRTHTGEKPFVCSICSRRFTSASLLNEHKAMHSTDRPHKCDVCGAAFSRAKALYHHKHLHLGIKKFVCKLCGRAYAQMAGLAGHMRQHRMEDGITALPPAT